MNPPPRPELSTQAEVFREQARSCAGRSPLYAELCERLAEEPLVAEIAPDFAWDLPLRLLAGVHHLVLSGLTTWDDVPGTLVEHADFLRGFTAEQGIQTNEVRRSWVLAPLFLLLARETGSETLDLVELGASAGLNLIWDRYRYRYAAGEWGPADALLQFEGAEERPLPATLLRGRPAVRGRTGIDLNPLDVTREEDVLLLKSFVWADQTARLEVLERAIEATRRDLPELVRGDYVELLPDVLAGRRPDALTVVFQTASLGYLSAEARQRVYGALADAAREHPIGWISAAPPLEEGMTAWGMDVRVLPGTKRIVAHADFHGTWLDWFGPA